MGSKTLIIGNGDISNLEEAKAKAKETSADGVMIGRGIFGNPWLFNKETKREDISLEERLGVMVEHTKLFEKICSHKNFAVMKKHYKAYVTGFDGAKELRIKLMDAKDASEVEGMVSGFFKSR
jgi:tRNA-dihydrouridine synthase